MHHRRAIGNFKIGFGLFLAVTSFGLALILTHFQSPSKTNLSVSDVVSVTPKGSVCLLTQ